MRQKLGIAIALVKDAPNVLLDEPTSGLDPQSGREFLEILVQMRDQGKSVFMSTHDIFRAKLIADRIGFMRKGKLVMMKTPKGARERGPDRTLHPVHGGAAGPPAGAAEPRARRAPEVT